MRKDGFMPYLRAEIFKVLHRPYTYIFLLVILAGEAALAILLAMFLCEGLLVAGWSFTNANGNDVGFSTGAGMIAMLLQIGLYSTILIGDIVFSEQYKFSTLKNEVSYGVPRGRIYLGKLAVECLTALVLCTLVIAFYLGLCWIFLPHNPAADVQTLRAVGYCLLVSLPLWLGAQGLVNLVFFLIKSSTVGSFVAVGIFMGVAPILQLLGALVHPVFTTLYSVMLTTPMDLAPRMVGDMALLGRAWAVGAGWFIACTLMGLVLFRKREIN